MKRITIACKAEDTSFIDEVKEQFEVVSISKDTSVIGIESWIMITIGLAQLTFQVLSFFRDNMNKNPDRKIVTKDGPFTVDCDSDDELKDELLHASDE